MSFAATKVTVIAERVIQAEICRMLEAAGATGYTVIEGSGKGRHGVRSHDRPSLTEGALDIVKIESVVADAAVAERIAESVGARYFADYATIVYMEKVQVLRERRF